MIANRNKEETFTKNKNFFKKYHENVLNTGRVGSNQNIGGDITMFISGAEIDGKEYLIPLYNPDTGMVEGEPYQVVRNGQERTFYKPSQEAISRAKNYIKSGQLLPYTSPEEAELDRSIFYPQIVEN